MKCSLRQRTPMKKDITRADFSDLDSRLKDKFGTLVNVVVITFALLFAAISLVTPLFEIFRWLDALYSWMDK